MTEQETTPPAEGDSTRTRAAASSPISPVAKRARMASPNTTTKESLQAETETVEQLQSTDIDPPAETAPQGLAEDGDDLEADDGISDSGLGTDYSDTTSITSSIFKGIVEHGRRYQTVREGEYWGPSDEKQFESLQAGHIVYTLLEVAAGQKNPLFRSPVRETAQHILDIGTGPGDWPRQVADMCPGALVIGVDLSPPPDPFVPPNCKFEVDDVLKPWMFKNKFELIHMRDMFGSFTEEQWRLLYKQAYRNLVPGGWIEQAESSINWISDDGSVKPDSIMAEWGGVFTRACGRMGKNINTVDTFRASIEAAGFTNVQERLYKAPIGDWVKKPILKEVGRAQKAQILEGLEGYAMFMLTKFGEPEPWSPEEVQVYLAKTRKEFAEPGLHSYVYRRRVWAQKPLDA